MYVIPAPSERELYTKEARTLRLESGCLFQGHTCPVTRSPVLSGLSRAFGGERSGLPRAFTENPPDLTGTTAMIGTASFPKGNERDGMICGATILLAAQTRASGRQRRGTAYA